MNVLSSKMCWHLYELFTYTWNLILKLFAKFFCTGISSDGMGFCFQRGRSSYQIHATIFVLHHQSGEPEVYTSVDQKYVSLGCVSRGQIRPTFPDPDFAKLQCKICRAKYWQDSIVVFWVMSREVQCSTLKMEVICSSEMLATIYKTIRRRNTEDSRHLHRRENLRSYTDNTYLRGCNWKSP
jgi:hypothetical protein